VPVRENNGAMGAITSEPWRKRLGIFLVLSVIVSCVVLFAVTSPFYIGLAVT
jgi:hypothetical protein